MVSRWKIISVLFTVFLAVSLYGCYSFMGTPSTLTKNTVDLQYVQRADYSYTAQVKPSLLYDNRTQISEGEPLYHNLVEELEITLLYNFTQNPETFEMIDVTVNYEASATITGGSWSKTYHLKSSEVKPLTFTDTYTLNMDEIDEVVETIGEETGTRVYSYTYLIQPRIRLEGSAGGEKVTVEFNPALIVKFESGKVKFEGLENVKSDSITHYETEEVSVSFLAWSVPMGAVKTSSVLNIIAMSIVLAISIRFNLQERESRTPLEMLNGDVRDRIVEAIEPPEYIARVTIKVGSINDLAKISEETFKPIIHHDHIYHVLDRDVRYEFKDTKLV